MNRSIFRPRKRQVLVRVYSEIDKGYRNLTYHTREKLHYGAVVLINGGLYAYQHGIVVDSKPEFWHGKTYSVSRLPIRQRKVDSCAI